MIRIYDGNNYYRLELETDHTGLAPRKILTNFMDCPDPIIWVWDGLGGNSRRREIYPAYKGNRKPPKTDIYANFDMLEEVLKHTKAIQVKVPGYEGDDVVATLTHHYAKAGETVSIYSNDFDFGQLAGEYPKQVFGGFRKKATVPNELARYYKICVGDPSDNIPGIKAFGQKTWDDTDKDKLKVFVDTILNKGEVIDIGLPPRVKVDVDDIQAFAKIIDFFDVPMDLISDHMTLGVPDYETANTYLKGYFQ